MANVDDHISLDEWREDLESLRQNWLLDESQLITFAQERGVQVNGVIVGEPGEFHRLGWLRGDENGEDGEPRFHPFRLYILRKIIERKKALGCLFDQPAQLADLGEAARKWNDTVDLATIVEPLHWPSIIGSTRLGVGNEKAFYSKLEQFRRRVLELIKTLDSTLWRERHQHLRQDAAWMDGNDKLYALLRLSDWHQRKDLNGAIGGALWIRHLAEVIHRVFEEAHGEEWLQEFHAFGTWHANGLKRTFGSPRPFDDSMRAKPFLARAFGLFTGSSVRWYVEGHTEYYAALEILGEPSRTAVELINLRGNIKTEHDNAALKLEDWLKEDQALRRFSMISFDRDELTQGSNASPNVRAIAHQCEKDNVVGLIAAHRPDFEFDNFTLDEIAEVAARIDEAHGYSGAPVRGADWTGITTAAQFERRYQSVSLRKSGKLKGEAWGRALAAYAKAYPLKPDGADRPIWNQIRGALYGWMSNYDAQRERFRFDPVTFELVAREAYKAPHR